MIIAHWNFNLSCNFKCDYCLNDPIKKNEIGTTFEIVKPAIDRLKKDYFFVFIGGEPSLNKDFIKIISYVSKKFPVGLYTNMSLPMDELIKNAHPKNFKYIVGSLHVKERDRLNIPRAQIVEEHNKLKTAGFENVYITQVCDDYSLGKFDQLFNSYRDMGIQIIPTYLKSSPWYRYSYTKDQLDKIKKYHETVRYSEFFPYEIVKYEDFTGKECIAGNKYFIIHPNGNMYKCWSDLKFMGNFLKEPYFDENVFSNNLVLCDANKGCACPVCPIDINAVGDL